jgi:hypothetical protein
MTMSRNQPGGSIRARLRRTPWKPDESAAGNSHRRSRRARKKWLSLTCLSAIA